MATKRKRRKKNPTVNITEAQWNSLLSHIERAVNRVKSHLKRKYGYSDAEAVHETKSMVRGLDI